MNTNQYTQKTLEALQAAQQLAVEYQHNALEPAHLLHALAAQENGLIPQLLQKLNVDPGSFAAAVAEKLSALPRVSGSGRDPDKVYISQATDKVLSAAAREAKAMMDDFNGRRRDKQPLEYPSAGSTFKRPQGYFAGKLIEDAGLRGFRVGDAQVSEKHCGFVINRGEATAAQILELMQRVQERVKENSGVDLEPEVRLLGF